MSYRYNFPQLKAIQRISLDEQIVYMLGEANEAIEALDSLRCGDTKEKRIDLAMEVADVIHAAETALRIIERDLDITASSAQSKVIKKNNARRYYG